MNRLAELLHRTPEQVLDHLSSGDLTPNELQAALANTLVMVRNMRDSLGEHLLAHVRQTEGKQ